MKKALGQTVRDIKREVNKKVLKVPSVEQKVLDATSNEPWGPHGSLLADIAQASRNYHEYQMIMSVIWKRVNDTGKNWRHVYKALTVLDYLVAHGSERVIDDIREHAYQISTLSDFQYIDSNGRDQGNNVRKKSQSLVVLVNDKERIQEVRQKAAANKEKYRNTSSGSMYRPGSGGYGDDRYDSRYGNRDDDRNGYGRERDEDRYSYGREPDRYSRDSDDRSGRDGYKDDEYRGRSQSVDDYNYGPRSRSVDPDRDRSYEDDGQYSSRGSGAKADDHSQDGSTSSKKLERRYSEQNLGAPPSYEDAVGPAQSPTYSERDRESSGAPAPKPSSSTGASPSYATDASPPPFPASPPAPAPAPAPVPAVATVQDSKPAADEFDEFDPRGPFAASTIPNGNAPVSSANTEMDLLGSLSESFSSNSLALVPANDPSMVPEVNAPESFHSGPSFAANSPAPVSNQPFDDPFGDGPFRAVPTNESVIAQQQSSAPIQNPGSEFGDAFYANPGVQSPPANQQFVQQEPSALNHEIDILADILPPSGYPAQAGQSVSHAGFTPQSNEPQNSFQASQGQSAGYPNQTGQPSVHANYHPQSTEPVPQNSFMGQSLALTYPGHVQAPQMAVHSQNGHPAPQPGFPPQMGASQYGAQAHMVAPNPSNANFYGSYPQQHNFLSQPSAVGGAPQMVSQAPQMVPQASQMQSSIPMAPVSVTLASTVSSAIVPQQSNHKFETKSTVWADTLSRGLVDLNISGSKTNPLNDIGVDFDAINRKDKRMEKPTIAAAASTITMGKAMGSGSGMGRAGAGALRPQPNSMMGPGVNIGTAGGPGPGMNMGGYGANQPMGRGGMGMGMNMPGNMQMGGMGMGMNVPGNMQMGMNMPGNMQMGMNMGIGQTGVHPQQQTGYPARPGMPGYNPMMGSGNYGQQQYGGGYR